MVVSRFRQNLHNDYYRRMRGEWRGPRPLRPNAHSPSSPPAERMKRASQLLWWHRHPAISVSGAIGVTSLYQPILARSLSSSAKDSNQAQRPAIHDTCRRCRSASHFSSSLRGPSRSRCSTTGRPEPATPAWRSTMWSATARCGALSVVVRWVWSAQVPAGAGPTGPYRAEALA